MDFSRKYDRCKYTDSIQPSNKYNTERGKLYNFQIL